MTVTSAKCIASALVPSLNFWISTITIHLIFQQTHAAPNPPRSTVLIPDWSQYNYQEPQGKGTYAFGYDVEDPETNNIQFRSEERHANGTITGSYGYLEPDGNVHMVHYIADGEGYRATIENSARGGMLKPIPVLDDVNYIAYGYSPQMLAAMKSRQYYKQQKVHEQRGRPFDQLSEEQKLHFRPTSNENQKPQEKSASSTLEGQNELRQKLQLPFTNALPTIYPHFNYAHLGNDEKIEDNLDFLTFA